MKDSILWKGKRTAKYLGISYSWLLNAAKNGQVPYFKVGRDIRFNLREVLKALKSQDGRGND